MHLEPAVRRALGLAWWILLPPFAPLVARFSYERGCLNPYELLQPIMQRQATALVVAGIYVGAHVWFLAAAIFVVRVRNRAGSSGLSVPPVDGLGWKLLAMAVVLAVEQVPRAVWNWFYHAVGAC